MQNNPYANADFKKMLREFKETATAATATSFNWRLKQATRHREKIIAVARQLHYRYCNGTGSPYAILFLAYCRVCCKTPEPTQSMVRT